MQNQGKAGFLFGELLRGYELGTGRIGAGHFDPDDNRLPETLLFNIAKRKRLVYKVTRQIFHNKTERWPQVFEKLEIDFNSRWRFQQTVKEFFDLYMGLLSIGQG